MSQSLKQRHGVLWRLRSDLFKHAVEGSQLVLADPDWCLGAEVLCFVIHTA
jgi:hypothetical protein